MRDSDSNVEIITGTFSNFLSDVNYFLMGNFGGHKIQDWIHRMLYSFLSEFLRAFFFFLLVNRSYSVLNRVQDDAEVREQAVSAQTSWGKVPTVGENAQMGI